MKRLLLLFFSLLIFTAIHAQDEEDEGTLSVASQLIQDAQALYDEGKVQDISRIYQDIMASSPTRQEEVQARRLLTLSYLYLDEPVQSDQAMLDLLKTDPEFILEEDVESTEFINLWYSFRTKPIFALGVKGTLNYTFVNVQEKYSTMSLNNYNGKYNPRVGFGGGLTFEKTFNRWTINPELNLSIRGVYRTEEGSSDNGSQLDNIGFEESQQWLELPLMVQFQLLNKDVMDPRYRSGINPYVYLGPKGAFLLAASTTSNTKRDAGNFTETQEGVDRTDDNFSWAYSIVAGAGIKYYLYKGFVTADLRFDYGLSDTSKSLNSAESPNLPFGLGFVNDRIRQNVVSLNVGYVKFFYSPKKDK